MRRYSSSTSYQHALTVLEQWNNVAKIPKYGALGKPRITLERFRTLLRLLGNPQQGSRIVHVGGTSGKGSVSSMIAAMLTSSGKRAGLYISPHTTTAIERIAVEGILIAPSTFARLTNRVINAAERMERTTAFGLPSYLEMMLAIGLLYFRASRCEWIVLEVGMGGRWDPSVVLPPPRIAAITTIDFDHMDSLGSTLASIARHKAGIIKRASHVWTMERRPILQAILKRRCRAVGATWHGCPGGSMLSAVGMSGIHQQSNALLAQAIGRFLHLPASAIDSGIQTARLPCRFEIVGHRPRVVLDGAHNPQKIQSLATAINGEEPRALRILFAASEHKDTTEMLKRLPRAREIVFTRTLVQERTCADPAALLRRFQTLQHRKGCTTRVSVDLDLWRAFHALLGRTRPTETLLVTGSLYLVGELRKHWIPEETILQYRTSFPP